MFRWRETALESIQGRRKSAVEAAELLRNNGFDTMTVREQQLQGTEDSALESVCQAESRVLLTMDLDFADVRRIAVGQQPGTVVFRLARQDISHVMKVLVRALPLLKQHDLTGALWIVEETRIRMRP